MSKLFAGILLIACMTTLLLPFQMKAQLQSEAGLPFITNYSPKTYKAYPQTWCVQEDESGIMYFGIQSYIMEYDGVKWNKIPLLKSAVRSMAMHKDGLIYYGGFTDLGYLDNDSLGHKKAYSLFDIIPAENRNFLDVWTTLSTESGVYFQAREYIFRLEDKKPGSNEKRKIKIWKPATKFMYAFYIDNNYYVHQQGLGLFKMVNDSLVLIHGSEFLGKERMQVMLPYKTATNEKEYLIGMFYGGLYLFDGTAFHPFSTKADPIIKSGSLLYKGLLLKNGNYVLSTTGKGLVIIDAQGNLLQRINRDVGLQDESIYSNYQDKKGTLWLGLDNGISRVETASPITQFTLQSGINTGVLNISRFEGNLYIGTTNGLLVYNHKNSFFDPVPGIPQNQIFALLPDGKQLLVPGDGLFAVRNKKTSVIKESVSADLTLSGLYISKKYPDILLGGGTFGVAAFTRSAVNNASNESPAWKFAGYVPGITDQIWTFSENKDGTIWAGTQAGWVYKIIPAFNETGNLDLSKTKFEKYGAENGFKDGTGQVYNIKGVNYFFAENSLYVFDEQKKQFIPDSTFGNFKKGGGNTEYDMVEDQQGRVWIRFGKETRLAIPKPEGGYRFDDSQLSTIKELTIQKIYPESNGIVWVCTTDGLIRYDENLEKNVAQSYKTVIRFASAGKNILSTVISPDSKPVSVSYKNNTLRFEYAAPFFEQEDRTQYQTWLEGFENDWSDFGFNYYKEYTNIPTGDYHFHVRAKNVFQKISEEAVYHFSIYPPWYATWWAYTLYALAAVVLIYSIIRWRTRQLHEKHRELEKIVNERTSQLSHRVEELAVINSVQDGLVREMNMQGIYELVGEKIREIFDAQVIDIVTYDSKTNLLEDRYAYEKGDRTLVGTFEPKGFRKHVVESGQLLLINKDLDKKSIEFNAKVIHGELPKSAVFVPMISGGKVTGMISLQNLDKENTFSESSVSLLTTLSNSMSVALESARRFDETTRLLKETEQRNAELAVINSVQDGLVREMDMQGIYELVGEKIREIFDAQVIDIVTYDKKTNLIEDRYAYEKGDRSLLAPRQPKGFRKHVIDTGVMLMHNENVEQAMKDFNNEILIGEVPKSQVYVPMKASGEVNGIISLQNIDHEHAFSDSDVRLINTLANTMSIALESARLFDETKRLLKETEQRNAELAVINSVQDGLVREMDMQGIYELVGEKIRQIFDAQVIDIVMYDRKTKMIEDRYSYEKGDRTLLGPRKPFGFRKHVIDNKTEIVVNKDLENLSVQYNSPVIQGETPKSIVMVPMIAGVHVTGIISLQNIDHEDAFTESDVRLVNTLANTMSIALESARLFDETKRLLKETKQRNAELAVINSVQDGLVREMDMQGIYELVGEKIREIFDAQVIDIVTYDKKTNQVEDRYSYEKGDRSLLGAREPKGFRKHVIETGDMLLHNDNVEKAMREFGNEILIGEVPKSQVYVPMKTGSEVNGIISLQNIDHENAFSDSDIRLITTLSNTMSIALGSARLFDETKRLLKETEQRTAELAIINSVQEGLASKLDIQAIYDLVGDKIRDVFDTQGIGILYYDRQTNLITSPYDLYKGKRVYEQAFQLGKGLTSHIIHSGQPLLINENAAQRFIELGAVYASSASESEHDTSKSWLGVPLISGGLVNGVICLENYEREFAYSESDVSLLQTFANSMSVALENARLFDETTRLLKETEQRTAELAVINSVQDGLAKELDIQGIYDLVGERIIKVFNAPNLVIRTFDHEAGFENWRYAVEKGERQYIDPKPFVWHSKQLIQTQKPIQINENYLETSKKFGGTGVFVGQPTKSGIFVPMIVGGIVKGSVSLHNVDKEFAYTEADLRLLTTITNSMSVALENARLFDETSRLLKETEQRTAELSVINSVQEGLAKVLSINGIYELVGEKIRQIFNAQVIDITTYDRKSKLIEDRYAFEKGDRSLLGPRAPKGFRKHVIETRQPLVINEDIEKHMLKYDNVVMHGEPSKSVVFVPMITGGEVVGVISLQNIDQENAFSDSEVSLLKTLANSMTVALESARLFAETTRLLSETEQRTAELSVINSVQDGLAKELDIQGIYLLVGEKMRDIFNAQVIDIVTYDKTGNTIEDRYTYEDGDRTLLGPRPLKGFRKHVIETAKSLVINKDVYQERSKYDQTVITGKGAKSIVLVPMIASGEVTGVISLQNLDQENAFSESDVNLLTTLSNSMSVALESARLFDETNRLLKETEMRQEELATINSVQEGLVREMNTKAIYSLVGNRICELFDTQTLIIRTFDYDTGLEHCHYAIEKGVHLSIDPKPIIWANKQLIETKQPLLINKNYVETAKKFGGKGVGKGLPPKSALFVPMIVGDMVKGSVSLQNVDKEDAFDEADLRLLTTMTNSMSVALENARLFDETKLLLAESKQRATELSTVNSISKALASQLDPDDLIKMVGDQLQNLFKANIIYLALLDKKTNIIEFPYQYGDNMAPLKLGEGLTSKIIMTGEPILINKDLSKQRTQMGIQLVGLESASYLGVPIPVGDENIGVLSVQSTEHENLFNENDLRLLSTIGSSVGVALRNATLFEDVQQAKMEAEAAGKAAEKANEAKSAFLSTVSHELRTPLTSVLGFAKIIKKRLEERIFPLVDKTDAKIEKAVNQVSENLHVVISEGTRLTHLINDVLDLAKIEAGKMEFAQENVSMFDVAERALAATTSLFEQKSLKLIRKIDENLPDVIGDKDKLIQVMINLISNSVKFTDKGSITCTVKKVDNEIIASITDTGIGIAMDDYSAVFEQFKQVGGDTLTDKPKGTGLGLPICKEIVEHLGGRIWLESEVGKGSIFSFALPIKKTDNVERPIHLNDLVKQLKEQVASSKLNITGLASTILIVDDDDSIRSLLHQELGDAGYLIIEAKNGKEALDCVRKQRPDLIILDIMMPEMNGFDVAAVLKNDPNTMDIPIIVLSVVQDKARGFRIGVDRYLTKPIDTGLLFSEVGSLLEQGNSRKKVLIVDEDSDAVKALSEVLKAKGYEVSESKEKELVSNAIANLPDVIIINSVLSGKQDIVQTLRFEKGLENVLFVVYQ